MCEVIITPEQIEDLERRKPDLRQVWERWSPILAREEALRETASAHKRGLEAGGEAEAERLMRAKSREINPPKEAAPEEESEDEIEQKGGTK